MEKENSQRASECAAKEILICTGSIYGEIGRYRVAGGPTRGALERPGGGGGGRQ